MTDDIRFDRDMQTLLEQLPEEQLPAARVTPWRQAMRCVLWGIGLTSITLNFWNLQHLLPMVGSILLVPAVLSILQNPRTIDLSSGWGFLTYSKVQQYLAILVSWIMPPDSPYLTSIWSEGVIK